MGVWIVEDGFPETFWQSPIQSPSQILSPSPSPSQIQSQIQMIPGETKTNSEANGFELQIRRNDGTTPIAELVWGDDEVSRKSLLLNIPMVVGDFFKLQVIKPTNNSIVNYSYMIAGSL